MLPPPPRRPVHSGLPNNTDSRQHKHGGKQAYPHDVPAGSTLSMAVMPAAGTASADLLEFQPESQTQPDANPMSAACAAEEVEPAPHGTDTDTPSGAAHALVKHVAQLIPKLALSQLYHEAVVQ